MRAVRRTVDGIATVDVPRPEGDGVRVHVRSAGICGSDLHMAGLGPSPITIGHEFGGVLDDGTAVAVKPNASCGTCDDCLRGRANLCRQAMASFYGQSLDGGMAEEALVSPALLVRLPPEVPPELACLVEPVSIAVHAAHRGDLQPGMRVLVIGGGTIGLTMVMAARALGVDIDVAARHPHQCHAVEALGGRVAAERGYDVVVDAVGSQASIDDAFHRVRPGGTLVEVGGMWEPVEIGLKALLKEVAILPAIYSAHHHGESEFDQAVQVLAATPQAGDVLVTHRFPLERSAAAFSTAADKSTGALKVVLHP